MNTHSPINEDVAAAIEEIVRREMGPFGLREVTIKPGEDHDGDPVLWVETSYTLDGQPIEPDVVAGLVSKLRERLWALGETRFPHVRHRFLDEQKVVEDT